MDFPDSKTVVIVGGASGVGKSSLLSCVSHIKQLSTGTYFKAEMSAASRDDIRKSDWTQFEKAVSAKLTEDVVDTLSSSVAVVVDTHFAAKVNNKTYRVGLHRQLVFEFASKILSDSRLDSSVIVFLLVHVQCEPQSLLKRRRLDISRNREVVPSDCIMALSRNRDSLFKYHSEILRATLAAGVSNSQVRMVQIENSDLTQAQSQFLEAFMGG
jgi:adenylate kinase